MKGVTLAMWGVAKQGYTLAGAGGGGFILLVTKKPNDRPHPALP